MTFSTHFEWIICGMYSLIIYYVFMDIGPSPINVIRIVFNKTLVYRLV